MKTYLDCIPCFFTQALKAGRAATKDEKLIKTLLDSIGDKLKVFSLDSTTPEMADIIYKEIKRITGVDNPYEKIKKENIEEALSLYPELKRIVENSEDRLLTAIRIAIAGNVIDLGANEDYNMVADLNFILKQEFAILHFDEFSKLLKSANSVLYLGDNAGESVFDKILIEQISKPVTYVVRDAPVINDVTMQDAIDSGIDEVADIISSGSTAPSIILSMCSEEFVSKFNDSDLIISKGQGNYEGLSETTRPVFFLLKAKCPVIANELNLQVGDIVLKISDKYKKSIY